MSKRYDDLEDADMRTTDRLNYATGVMLSAEDFAQEQLYHRGRLARALAFAQGHGTVAGLLVEYEAADGDVPEQIKIHPGIAIDSLGRLIELPRMVCIRLDNWFDDQPAAELRQGLRTNFAISGQVVTGVIVDVVANFVVCEHGKTPAFASGPYDALDAVQSANLRDYYQVTMVIPQDEDAIMKPEKWRNHLETAFEDIAGGTITDPMTELSAEQRLAGIKQALLHAWDSSDADELAAGTAGVPLARVAIPAADNPDPTGPQRVPGDVVLDNLSRPFVYPATVLAQVLNW